MKFARHIAHVTVVNARLAERRAVKRADISPVRNPDNIVRQSLMRARLATPAIRRTSTVRRDIKPLRVVQDTTRQEQLTKNVGIAAKHPVLAINALPAPGYVRMIRTMMVAKVAVTIPLARAQKKFVVAIRAKHVRAAATSAIQENPAPGYVRIITIPLPAVTIS